jgi:hypothetical protein
MPITVSEEIEQGWKLLNESIMKTLEKFSETSQVIELKNFPFLEDFITEIFMS